MADGRDLPHDRIRVDANPRAEDASTGTNGLGRLRRLTSSGRSIPEIDGLRFVAITSVCLYHVRGYLLARDGPFVETPCRIAGTP